MQHIFLIVTLFVFLQSVNGLAPESDKVWPNVPVPPNPPLPICNGCGSSSDNMMLIPSTSVGGICQKYG